MSRLDSKCTTAWAVLAAGRKGSRWVSRLHLDAHLGRPGHGAWLASKLKSKPCTVSCGTALAGLQLERELTGPAIIALPSYCRRALQVTPIVNRPEVHAVFGDFGYANDVCMDQLIKDAEAGVYDSVLHVGDWAYNFEDKTSSIGNDFMNDIQGYAGALRRKLHC